MANETSLSETAALRCGWLGDTGDQHCFAQAERVVIFGDEPHLSCAAHAAEEASDPIVSVLGLLEEPVPLTGGTWLVASDVPEGVHRGSMLIAWNEPDPTAPGGSSPTCAWFDPEDATTAPRQWPTFDAYYEVLCDPAELASDDTPGAEAAAAEVRSYLRDLNPDPTATRVFRCQWRPEYDGIDGGHPDHGWALVIPFRVRAAFSVPEITGSAPLWSVSAEAVVDANSWTGAEHGWGVGCAHLLHIVSPGGAPPLTLVPAAQE